MGLSLGLGTEWIGQGGHKQVDLWVLGLARGSTGGKGREGRCRRGESPGGSGETLGSIIPGQGPLVTCAAVHGAHNYSALTCVRLCTGPDETGK